MVQVGATNMNNVVCDNGSGYLKIGFAGDNFPRDTIPSIVGTPELRSEAEVGDVVLKPIMFGDEANPLRQFLKIEYPIAEGMVKNWDMFEQLWEYIFYKKLNLPEGNLGNHNILITEAALNPTKNREKMA